MALQIVTIGDYHVSREPEDIIVTYALGSCVAVLIHDPQARIGGLIHVLLPDSKLDRAKAKANPLTFADTGIPLLFQKAYSFGASKERLRVGIAGGAATNITGQFFNVGAENINATRSILHRARVPIHSESVGGNAARTVRLHVGTGRMSLHQTQTGGVRHLVGAC